MTDAPIINHITTTYHGKGCVNIDMPNLKAIDSSIARANEDSHTNGPTLLHLLFVMSGLWNRFRAILYTLTPISIFVCSTQPQHGYTDFSQLANNNYIFLYFRIPRLFCINATPLLRVAINKLWVYILWFY